MPPRAEAGSEPQVRTILEHLSFGPQARDGLPLAPGYLPVAGHIPALLADLPRVLEGGAARGPLFWLSFGQGIWFLSSTHEGCFSILRNKETSSTFLARSDAVLSGAPLGKHSLLLLDGVPHRRVRGAMNGPFTPRGLGEAHAGLAIAEVIGSRVAAWQGRSSIDILDETREIAINVIFRMLGIPAAELETWRIRFAETLNLALPFLGRVPGSARWRGRRARAWLDEHLHAIIRNARGQAPGSMIAALAQGRDEHGESVTDEELVDNLRVLALAGHETTASTMTWMALHAAESPLLWDRLAVEAKQAERAPITPGELRQFPLAEGIFREAVRLYPPAPILVRRAIESFDLLGRTIAPGTLVCLGIHALSRDPQHYVEPHSFNPDRWLREDRRPSALETVQFGGGPHFCLGYHLAWLEAVHFIVTLARVLGPSARPVLDGGRLPSPKWLPVVRPPARTMLHLRGG